MASADFAIRAFRCDRCRMCFGSSPCDHGRKCACGGTWQLLDPYNADPTPDQVRLRSIGHLVASSVAMAPVQREIKWIYELACKQLGLTPPRG